MGNANLGTANILHQYSCHQDLKQEYSPETAHELAAKSLNRHGIPATPNDVASWDKINSAAVQGKMDIPAERQVAESMAKGVAQAIIASAHQTSDEHDADEEDLESGDAADVAEDELTTIDELYGFDNPEDNDEAALDDVLKAQEQA